MGKKRKSKRTLVLILVSLLQMGVSALLLNHLSMENCSVIYAEDSRGYLLVAHYFLGDDIPFPSLLLLKYRLFNPVVPFVSSLLARFLPLEYAFLFLNFCFWLFSACLFYRFLKDILNEQGAYYCALLFTTSLPLVVWGLPVMVDMAAFFFAVLNCFLITRLLSDKSPRYLIVALTLPLAILTKPTLVSLLLFFIVYAGFQRQYLRILPVVVITLITVSSSHVYHLSSSASPGYKGDGGMCSLVGCSLASETRAHPCSAGFWVCAHIQYSCSFISLYYQGSSVSVYRESRTSYKLEDND